VGDEPLSVVGYVRVSTEEQARDGVSLEAQTLKVRQYCELYGLRLVCVLCDGGESGKNLERPALREALELIDLGKADGLVVAKLDRLTRSVKDLGSLLEGYFDERAGKQLMSVGDSIDTRTAAGRLVLNVLMSVAQWERETIVERTREAIAHKRSKGERVGTVPYGFGLGRDRKTLMPIAEEQIAIDWIVSWHKTYKRSFAWIANWLNESKFETKSGRGRWYASTVAGIFKRAGR
jgi:site-specific DNA recombinase